MLTDLPGWVPQTGAVGVLMMAIWAVLTGRIVPRATHNETRADRDAYRRTAETALAAAAQSAASVTQLTSAVEQLAATGEQSMAMQREMLALVRAGLGRAA